jgi:dTDP-4-dehydrorhamnose reductase
VTSPAKILVFGRTGQVATEFRRAAWAEGVVVECLGRESVDVARSSEVRDAVAGSHPAVVVNTAAYTAVDRAESEPEVAFAANRDGAAYLAEACSDAGVPLIHISTDYVFDGKKNGAYIEDDPVNPINVYGASKEAGERAVRQGLAAHVILRTAWVYSPHGHNFVKSMLRLGREHDKLTVVDDQRGCPTGAADVARAIVAIASQLVAGKRDGFGTFHFCSAGATTWYGIACAIFELAAAHGAKAPRIKPIATTDYPRPAARPKNSVLDCSRIGRVYGIMQRPWKDCLTECIEELFTAGDERGAA